MRYLAFAGIAARQALVARGALVGRLAFYLVLMVVFSRLWAATADGSPLPGVRAGDLVWYLALTELLALGVPFLHVGIEEDVRRGEVAYRIARPLSYLGTRLAEGAGETLARFAGLATLGFAGAWLCAGGPPGDPRGVLLALPLCLLSAALFLLLQAAVGLAAFWFQEAAPFHWVTQKLLFVFGGLFFPLEVYPRWLRSVAEWTPFSAMVDGCARLALRYDPALAAATAVRLVAWGVVLALLVAWLWRRGVRILDVNGG